MFMSVLEICVTVSWTAKILDSYSFSSEENNRHETRDDIEELFYSIHDSFDGTVRAEVQTFSSIPNIR